MSSLPKLIPSILNWTPKTATLSEALADSDTFPDTVLPKLGEAILTDGTVVSVLFTGGGLTCPAPISVEYISWISKTESALLYKYTFPILPEKLFAPFLEPIVSAVVVSIAVPEPLYVAVPENTPSIYISAVFVALLTPVIECQFPSLMLALLTAFAVTAVPPAFMANVAFPPLIVSS